MVWCSIVSLAFIVYCDLYMLWYVFRYYDKNAPLEWNKLNWLISMITAANPHGPGLDIYKAITDPLKNKN